MKNGKSPIQVVMSIAKKTDKNTIIHMRVYKMYLPLPIYLNMFI